MAAQGEKARLSAAGSEWHESPGEPGTAACGTEYRGEGAAQTRTVGKPADGVPHARGRVLSSTGGRGDRSSRKAASERTAGNVLGAPTARLKA